MLETTCYLIAFIWIGFNCYCLFHYADKLKIANNEKKEIIKNQISKNLSNKGFKQYQWIAKYNYTSVRQGIIKTGTGYFRNKDELEKWSEALNMTLTFHREI